MSDIEGGPRKGPIGDRQGRLSTTHYPETVTGENPSAPHYLPILTSQYSWQASVSQFYSLWSFYWSYVSRKFYGDAYNGGRPSSSALPTNVKHRQQDVTREDLEGEDADEETKINGHLPIKVKNEIFGRFRQHRRAARPKGFPSHEAHGCFLAPVLPASCSQCDFRSKCPSEFQFHCWVNHGKHVCLVCGRSFAQKANRDRHMCLHTGARPYSCDMCNEKFSRGDKLKIHKSRSHGLKR